MEEGAVPLSLTARSESQSAFAGYGMEEQSKRDFDGVGRGGRNPLSLDMGWKSKNTREVEFALVRSQSAFAGYGMEERADFPGLQKPTLSQSAFAGYGMEECSSTV